MARPSRIITNVHTLLGVDIADRYLAELYFFSLLAVFGRSIALHFYIKTYCPVLLSLPAIVATAVASVLLILMRLWCESCVVCDRPQGDFLYHVTQPLLKSSRARPSCAQCFKLH